MYPGGPKKEITVCVCLGTGCVLMERSRTASQRPAELLIGHLPNEQVGRRYFGQREHSVQRNVVSAHIASLWLLNSDSASFQTNNIVP